MLRPGPARNVAQMETERLVLRRWRADDAEALAAVFAEPAVWRYPVGRGLSRQETDNFLDRQHSHWTRYGFGLWAAEGKADGRLIGFIGLAVPEWLPEVLPAVEVGYRLHPEYWGKGLATEGGRASLEHGFETLGLDRIIGIFMPENVASGRVMDKLGLREWRTTSDPRRGVTLTVREITRDEWSRPR